MSRKVPKVVRDEICQIVFDKADAHHFLQKTRPENAAFLESLVVDPSVGGVLDDYMPPARVRIYLKDSILNAYSKARRKVDGDLTELLGSVYNAEVSEIDRWLGDQVSLHRTSIGTVVAVARANYDKWGTWLQKLLLRVAAAPGLPPQRGTPFELALVVYCHGIPCDAADKRLLEAALDLVGVRCIWA